MRRVSSPSLDCALQISDSNEFLGPSVMINGLPGPMATAVAETCLDRGLNVIPLAFTGPGIQQNEVIVEGKKRTQWVELVVGPGSNPKASDILAKLKEDNPDLIIVDYTHPDAVLGNVETYVKNSADFVMGTTGVVLMILTLLLIKGIILL